MAPPKVGTGQRSALDCALAAYGRRLILELTCSCLDDSEYTIEEEGSFEGLKIVAKEKFQPVEALGFVLRVAASPRFDETYSVDVISAAGQVYAFRRYAFIQRDWLYRETMRVSETSQHDGRLFKGPKDILNDQEEIHERVNLKDAFRPVEALGFVNRVAVSPWVDDVDSGEAIRAACQVLTFRRNILIKHDLVYQGSTKRQKTDCSTTLHMKFPKDSKLPSKKELVKRFRRFGPLDYSKTKVFFYTGSAQMVFLHHLDAQAACHYAQRKRIFFGGANVQCRVCHHEQSRRRSNNISAPLPTSMPILKPCLRISNPPGAKKVERRDLHVTFSPSNQYLAMAPHTELEVCK